MRNPHLPFAFALALAFPLLASPLARADAPVVTGFAAGTVPTPSVADLVPAQLKDDEYAESLSFTGFLDDGSRLNVTFAVSNIGMGAGKGGLKGVLVSPGGARTAFSQENGRSWSARATPFEYTSGAGRLTGSLRHLALALSHPKMSGEVVFTAELPPFRPRSGRIHYGPSDNPASRFYDYLLVMPRARLSGHLVVNGRRVRVSGDGLVERSRLNIYPFNQAIRWRSLRIFDGDTSVVLQSFQTPRNRGGRTIGFVVVGHKGRIVLRSLYPRLSASDVRQDPTAPVKYPVPWRFELEAKGGANTKISGTIKVTSVFDRVDGLAGIGRLRKLIVSRFAKPLGYAQRCQYDLVLERGEEPPLKITGDRAECWQSFLK